MKKLLMLAVLALLAMPAVAGAKEEMKSGLTKEGKPFLETSDRYTKQATVIKIDKQGRYVTLRGESGDTLKVKAGEDVKNFAQIKVGDLLKVTYTEKLSIYIEAPGPASMTTDTYGGTAKAGAKPAASLATRTQYKATIKSIDKEKGTATLAGYDGKEFVVTPIHPENLDKVKIGELVVFTHTMGIAASIEKVPPKKK